jgi:hypothetical protein
MLHRMWWAIAREQTIDHSIPYFSPKNDFD